jgi:ubiquinone/menaquinone biosynthesis C-methylase UbiE
MDRNPQREQMADESMYRTLAAQAQAIWPQETLLLDRYGLAGACHIADIGCGSGEISSRLAHKYLQAQIIGVDVLETSVALAQRRFSSLAPRLRFDQGDAFALSLASNSQDLVLCRHVTQAVPQVELLLAELTRITRPGGWLHVLSEDYAMLHAPIEPLDSDVLWSAGPISFSKKTHTDARIGRRTWQMLLALGFEDLRVDYIVVDTLRVPRATFAAIIEAWRDGYADIMSTAADSGTAGNKPDIHALFAQVIAHIRDPRQYVVWHVPIISGRKPLTK